MAQERPNIVLICVDQWRGDCLSVDGHPVVRTPYLDELALNGVRFGRAYSATPTCIPARAALFTGQTQHTHGRVGYKDGVNWNYPVTLAGEFTRHGYQTQSIGKMHVHPARAQMGFQNVLLHDGYLHFGRKESTDLTQNDDYLYWLREREGRLEADYFENGLNCNSVVARPWDRPEHLHPTNWVTSQSIDFLRRRDPSKPFFLFMSYHRPHPPYDPPRWAFEQYMETDMPDPPVGDWAEIHAGRSDPHRPDCQVGPIDPDMLHRARAGYYGHMSHIDAQVNRFIEALGDRGMLNNTWICFTSDHGEMLGDHNLFRKSMPYEGSARIPMILTGPHRDASLARGLRRDEPVELRDVMPTLLECAGLPVPETVEGMSMAPFTRGESTEWRGHIHGEHTAMGQSVQYVTDGREKYLWFSGDGMEQLFDLVADPEELHDLARFGERPERVEHWRGVLAGELEGREEGFAQGGRLVPGRDVNSVLSRPSAPGGRR